MWWGFSNDERQEFPPNVYRAPTLDAALELLSQNGDGLDICEMCGGAGRTLKIAIRRRLKTGRNFDLVTGCDLGDPQTQRKFKEYLENNNVLLVTMAPNCRSWGSPHYVNQQINPETYERHRAEDEPHAFFCAEVALIQMKRGRYFLVEQPQGTSLFAEKPWMNVVNDPSIVYEIVHQCMLGQLGPDGRLAKSLQLFWVTILHCCHRSRT